MIDRARIFLTHLDWKAGGWWIAAGVAILMFSYALPARGKTDRLSPAQHLAAAITCMGSVPIKVEDIDKAIDNLNAIPPGVPEANKAELIRVKADSEREQMVMQSYKDTNKEIEYRMKRNSDR